MTEAILHLIKLSITALSATGEPAQVLTLKRGITGLNPMFLAA
jgi:hypothetical protein